MVGYDVVLYESIEDAPCRTLELILSGLHVCVNIYIVGTREHCIYS